MVLLVFPRYSSTSAETNATPASGVLYISRIGKRTRSTTAIGDIASKPAATEDVAASGVSTEVATDRRKIG